ncbi:uncharacterized protein Z519_11761 [Cladophialophora bantiana CBS 173.52]|uniref:Uncharacterized protein n=1 Tax=Cladophialophora bantiana (strain ATCC 10958 / CBS 173.52 / CDC B-1940 / NIH 8579) TaxID=1442370 RepID=A0A0D2FM40_CLAB1|nr:uncharacterized protein Z519_11761 [Cladophialophora bantiana CBS 173.52]KIW87787.1 hypothetical protein Z519_11761 [Cladophialophora bantiana CBS 173.52]
MAQPNLWYRTFTRHEGDDIDRLADPAFLNTNFIDFFGKWLQQDQNSDVLSFDALMMGLWGNSTKLLNIHFFKWNKL